MVAGWGGQKVPPAIQFADILLLNINYTSPPSFSQIGLKLPKFLIPAGFGMVGVGLTWAGHFVFLLVVSLRK